MSTTVVTLIQSCSKPVINWKPQFLSQDEAEIVARTLEVMLPTTPDIPGATDLNLTQFIDGYLHTVSTEKEKAGFKAGIEQYLSTTLEIVNKSKVIHLTTEDIDGRLAYYLKANPSQQKAWNIEVTAAKNEKGQLPSVDAVNFSVLKSLRSKAISAFKATEFIGEEVLAYAPIPGEQKGCVDLQSATEGKAWAL